MALERFFMGPRHFTPVGRAPGKCHVYSCLLEQFPSLPAPRPRRRGRVAEERERAREGKVIGEAGAWRVVAGTGCAGDGGEL